MIDIMWLFTVPVLKVAIKVGVALSTIFLVIQVIRWYIQSFIPNPFAEDDRKKRKPYIHDQKQRDAVIKQGFSINKVPDNLDAVVIGSGIGGLGTAAIMAKAGKKVLVLEQHDQAGGCCHSFIDKGYEWDVGIHYIGKMDKGLTKTLVDQISDGQLEWDPLDDNYDQVSIGYGKENRRFDVTERENWIKRLKKEFPDEEKAIDKYFKMVDEFSGCAMVWLALKNMPLWLAKFICKTGLINFWSKLWKGENNDSTLEVVRRLTSNKDLQTIFCYCWGDYGCMPSESHFTMQALLMNHYGKSGGYYPVGGASEIAFNMIPVIERAGGRVLVRVNVIKILHNGKKAMGVRVKKGTETHNILAPLVISNAGVYNTFETLLPRHVAEKSYFYDIVKQMKPGVAGMNVFLGLNASDEQLGLKKHNVWAFTSNESGLVFKRYLENSAEEALDDKPPLIFISFPSAKDPEWKKHPGREAKSTCSIITLNNWEWYKKWQANPVKNRGDDYTEIKDTIGHQMIEQACQLFPQIKNHIDFIEIGSPVTNKYYLAQPNGEIYGLDHNAVRTSPMMQSLLRPETDIPGLILTGQDVFTCGFTGALYGGLLAAWAALDRNVVGDLMKLHTKLKKASKKSE